MHDLEKKRILFYVESQSMGANRLYFCREIFPEMVRQKMESGESWERPEGDV